MNRFTIKGLWVVLGGVAISALIAWGLTTWNVTKVQAGGSPQPMYQAISDMFTAGNTVTIWTRAPLYKTNNTIYLYPIHQQDSGKDYFLTRLGIDVICLQMSVPPPNSATPVCVPFSSIDFFSYGK
ncbi:MAG: hypothetical protein ACYDBJ_17535 [Aggregatilineales bacterium]